MSWGTLELSPIGNCNVSALIDRQGRYVWACAPRPDGDPVFCALLGGRDPSEKDAHGYWDVALEGAVDYQQHYLRNTAVLRTVITDDAGGSIEIVDYCPRYQHHGRTYRPVAFARVVKPLSGSPRIRVRLRVASRWGGAPAGITSGSNHIRYVGDQVVLRLTTNASVTYVLDQTPFRLEKPLYFFLGPDESFAGAPTELEDMRDRTAQDWRLWVRGLAIPLEWQEPVIRAAIGLKLCCYEETGAIMAAMTTSVPESPGTQRNWDYRYCWLRDAYYVVQALNRLGAVDVLENYLTYLRNLGDNAIDGVLQPVYGIGLESILEERTAPSLAGYRGMGPVRIGNAAYFQRQNDVYGQVILSSAQAFFDERLLRPAGIADFEALERMGDQAFARHDEPDAGLWELRTKAETHTYSTAMCWAACDRLENIAIRLGLKDRAEHWRQRAAVIAERISRDAWNADMGSYVSAFGGDKLDASLLQLIDIRFAQKGDPRFEATLDAIRQSLVRGDHVLRYAHADDFGEPENAFNICTFWYIEALAQTGRHEEGRRLFEIMLSHRTSAGLLSEDLSISTGELWGNYPQTYSLVGLINAAMLLSKPWSSVR